MSGGHFDYNQYKISEIADDIQHEIDNNGRELSQKELDEDYSYRSSGWYDRYPEDKFYREYPEEVINEFKNAVKVLRTASVYAQRVDWLLSDDDGEESFLRRLKKELDEI